MAKGQYKLRATGRWILAVLWQFNKTPSGKIHIPGEAIDTAVCAKVLSVGADVKGGIKKGDVCMFPSYAIKRLPQVYQLDYLGKDEVVFLDSKFVTNTLEEGEPQ